MGLQERFGQAIWNSIKNKKCLNIKRNDNKYFDDRYADEIKKYFKESNVKSFETNYNKKFKCTSICALASSGRLCYLHFKPQGAQFEVELKNDLPNSRPTKMDAVIGNVNYECKCQEIVHTTHTPLKERYYDESLLFKELFNGPKPKTVLIPKEDSNTESEIYLTFPVSALNIKLKGDPEYAHLRFDLKQLICHLIAIAKNADGKEQSLQYVFFTPNKNQIKNVQDLYDELRVEINAIFAKDSKINKFAHNHKITIEEPLFIPIDTIEDFVYKNTFKD